MQEAAVVTLLSVDVSGGDPLSNALGVDRPLDTSGREGGVRATYLGRIACSTFCVGAAWVGLDMLEWAKCGRAEQGKSKQSKANNRDGASRMHGRNLSLAR